MDIGRYVAQLRDDLTAAAAAGDEQTQRTAALLGAALEPAARLTLMNALADLAAEITAELGDRTVDVRLDGRDIRVAVGPEHVADAAAAASRRPAARASTPATSAGSPCASSSRSRARPSRRPRRKGVSLNSWVAQAVQGALSGQRRRGNGGPRGPRGNWGAAWDGPDDRETDRPGGPDDGRHLRGWVEG